MLATCPSLLANGRQWDSNPRPESYESTTLTTRPLTPVCAKCLHLKVCMYVLFRQDWFGMLYSFADSKKKSNLMLSVFAPGDYISFVSVNVNVIMQYYHYFRFLFYQPIYLELIQVRPGPCRERFWVLLLHIFYRQDAFSVAQQLSNHWSHTLLVLLVLCHRQVPVVMTPCRSVLCSLFQFTVA